MLRVKTGISMKVRERERERERIPPPFLLVLEDDLPKSVKYTFSEVSVIILLGSGLTLVSLTRYR